MSFSCGSFSPISFSTDCPTPPPIVQLDEWILEKIIEWEDLIVEKVPDLPVVGKATATLHTSVLVKQPTVITLTVRMTHEDKDRAWSYYEAHAWHCLSQNYVPIACVWIENLAVRNDCKTDKDRPWLVTLTLVCRSI